MDAALRRYLSGNDHASGTFERNRLHGDVTLVAALVRQFAAAPCTAPVVLRHLVVAPVVVDTQVEVLGDVTGGRYSCQSKRESKSNNNLNQQ